MKVKTMLKKLLVSEELERYAERVPHSLGSMGYDPWGLNMDTAKIGLAVLHWAFHHYFRVQVTGLENVPTAGGALIISNHSGQLPTDGMMIGVAMATNPDGPRFPRAMVERFAFNLPYVGNLFTQLGSVVGDPENCIKMLKKGETVIVFPEGARGGGKIYKYRYQLQRFGTGFMHIAMASGVPIVPVGVVGGEETMPALINIKPLARLLRWPSFPLAFPFPLPARMYINIGKPLSFPPNFTHESEVEANVEEVKKAIRALMDKGLSERKSIYL
ncbi:MAG: lysophospholipid acyltransferase family protein [Thermodesulfobacteriota bacterium]